MRIRWPILFTFSLLTGCAQLHHIQIADIDGMDPQATTFDVKASNTGLDVGEAAGIARAIGESRAVHDAASGVSTAWALVTFGPRTGDVTFSDDYADSLARGLASACPAGRISSLASIRESTHYPVVSGEIVRYVGTCSKRSLK